MPETSYDRPIKARLWVHLETGESWEATDADLEQFRLIGINDAYMRFDDALTRVLTEAELIDGDLTLARLNPLRYLTETAICHPDLMDHAEHRRWMAVADIERTLQDVAADELAEAMKSS